MARLTWVQARFNAFPFRTDEALWGKADYWESPEEFLAYGGDCEDYALAKMAALRALGWREEDLELQIVSDMDRQGVTHAVLRARLNGKDWLLDNQSQGLRPAEGESRYLVLYGVNALGGHWY